MSWEKQASEVEGALLKNTDALMAHFIKTASHDDFVQAAGEVLQKHDQRAVESIRAVVAQCKKYGSI